MGVSLYSGAKSWSLCSLSATEAAIYAGERYKTVAGAPYPYLSGYDLPVRTASPLQLPSGLFQFNLYGPLEHYFVFETSTNLVDWTRVLTNKAPLLFEDLDSIDLPHRYYWAIPLQ